MSYTGKYLECSFGYLFQLKTQPKNIPLSENLRKFRAKTLPQVELKEETNLTSRIECIFSCETKNATFTLDDPNSRPII